MKVKSKLEIEFAGVTLPVEKNEAGFDVVPLKPISDVFGVDWETQRKKVQALYLSRRLGSCTQLMLGAGQRREMLCIRVDRVASFLNQIDPDRVRANGNNLGADFLEQKQCEWDDVIHDYESQRGTLLRDVSGEAKNLALHVRTYIAVIKEKRLTEDAAEKRVLNGMAKRIAADAGIPHQEELLP